MENRIWYIDSTLRDGEQAPGVSFSAAEKITIAALLEVCGIDEVEAGTPAMGSDEQQIIRTIANQNFSFRTTSWCRALKGDIDAARNSKSEGINISFPVSEIHLRSMGKSADWVKETLPDLVAYAKNYFSFVAIGAQDATRANFDFLNNFISMCSDLKVDRVRIADTVGCQNPFTCQNLISSLLHLHPNINLEYHAHNDLGMATANTLAAITAGVQSISTTINGLGERAGNASLDEVAMACRKTLGLMDKLNSRFFPYLSNYVENASGRKNSDSKPVVGKAALQHESGIHTRCLIEDPQTYQLLNSDELGKNGPEIVFGKHSGTAAVLHFFEEKGIRIDKDALQVMMQQIRLFANMKKKAIHEDELLDLYYRMS